MPINNHDKIQLLVDLLQNQATEHYMSIDEANQIDQLLSTLANDPEIQSTLQQTLVSIQQKHQLNTEPFQQEDVEEWLQTLQIE